MSEYKVQGQWDLRQSNNIIVHLDIRPPRPDGSFVATATYGNVQGAGFGLVRDNQFTVQIRWTAGTEGAYIGVFDEAGKLRGATFDVTNPQSTASWSSDRSFQRS